MIFPVVMGLLGLIFLLAGAVEVIDPYFNRLVDKIRNR